MRRGRKQGSDSFLGLKRSTETQQSLQNSNYSVHCIVVTGSVLNLANPTAGVDTGLVKYLEVYP